MFLDTEKMPHPPAYTEIYPVVTDADANAPQMGWQQPAQTEIVNTMISQPIQPPPYGTQQPGEIRKTDTNKSRVLKFFYNQTKISDCNFTKSITCWALSSEVDAMSTLLA